MWVDLYPWLKHTHMLLAVLSGGLFAVRGLAVALGSRKALSKPLRLWSVGIDICLLGMAVLLLAAYDYALLHAPWLQYKLLLLVVYIVLGVVALRARRPAVQLLAYAAAVLCLLHIYGMALLKSPWGWWALLAR